MLETDRVRVLRYSDRPGAKTQVAFERREDVVPQRRFLGRHEQGSRLMDFVNFQATAAPIGISIAITTPPPS